MIKKSLFRLAPFLFWALVLAGTTFTHADSLPLKKGEKIRCGWFDNSAPNTASLIDPDGEWIINRTEGGPEPRHEAVGDWPTFKDQNFVTAGHGSYGHGCTCMKVSENAGKQITRILWAKEKPLSACRKDPKLKKLEPFNPLKE